MLRKVLVLLAAAVLTACGDPGPDRDRGYVKPPLEKPGLVVRGEEVSEMAELGEPVRPRPREPEEVAPQEVDG